MIHKFNQFEIPGIYYFEAKNYFTGSRKGMNFKIVSDGSEMTVTTWHGFLCSDLAEPEETNQFPVNQEGHDAMLAWLEEIWQKSRTE